MDYPMGPIQDISYTFNYILIATIILSIFVLTFSNEVDKLIKLFPKLERLLSNIDTCLWVIMLAFYLTIIIYCIIITFQ